MGGRGRGGGAGGGREVALLAYPLILGHLSFTVQTFVDRLFLTWYSPEAVAGAVTGLFAVWSIVALFTGTGEYLTTFVAQYLGAGRPGAHRAGPLAGRLLLPRRRRRRRGAQPVRDARVRPAGHAPALRAYEVEYAGALMLGAFPVILMATLSTFFAGRGQTQAVLRVNVLATVVNVVLDYLLIFGHGGFPELGVKGAALATVLSGVVSVAVYAPVILSPGYRTALSHAARLAAGAGAGGAAGALRGAEGLQFFLEVGAFAGSW